MKTQIDQLMTVINDLTYEMSRKISENEFNFNDLAVERLQLLKELFARSSEIPKNQLYNYIMDLRIYDEKIIQALNQECSQFKKTLQNLNSLQRYHE